MYVRTVYSVLHVYDQCYYSDYVFHAIPMLLCVNICTSVTHREAINVLTFSIKAAEKALRDVNSPVVDKLEEGRLQRLRDLESASAIRASAIDQRSAEVCAVNISELEGRTG